MKEPNVSNTVSELEELVSRIVALYDEGDYARAIQLIDTHILQAWYGLLPERFVEMLHTIHASGVEMGPLSRMLHGAISGGSIQLELPESVARKEPVLFPLTQMFSHRLQGDSHAAMQHLNELDTRQYEFHPLLDKDQGWGLFISLQSGITAMLAGKFHQALNYFLEAQMHRVLPDLAFLTRDAYAKAAHIHALFGDAEEAHTALCHAAAIPRTSSWAEGLIDANASMAEAVLAEDPQRGRELLSAFPVRSVGEQWPFYALSLYRVLERAGRHKTLEAQIAALERIPFQHSPGKGFIGSVLPFIRGSLHLQRGDLAGAHWFLSSTDMSDPTVRLLSAQIDLEAGKVQQAIDTAWQLGNEDQDLRQLDLWRYGIIATGYFKLGHRDKALEALLSAESLGDGIRTEDLRLFGPEITEYAAEHVASWPEVCTPVSSSATEVAQAPVFLTAREREILRLLATDATRTEMADELFVSVNTLKSHLSAIYKKLGVSNRTAALLRAAREGWLSPRPHTDLDRG